MDKDELRQKLEELSDRLVLQVAELDLAAEKIGCTTAELRTSTGDFLLTSILATQATILRALVDLERL